MNSYSPFEPLAKQNGTSPGLQFFPLTSNSTSFQNTTGAFPSSNPKLEPETYYVSAPVSSLKPTSSLPLQPNYDSLSSKPIINEISQLLLPSGVQTNPLQPNILPQPQTGYNRPLNMTSSEDRRFGDVYYFSPQSHASDKMELSQAIGKSSFMNHSSGQKYSSQVREMEPSQLSSIPINTSHDALDTEEDARIVNAKRETDELLKNLMEKYSMKSPDITLKTKGLTQYHNRPYSFAVNSSASPRLIYPESSRKKVEDITKNQFYKSLPASTLNSEQLFSSSNLEGKKHNIDYCPQVFEEFTSPQGIRAFKDPYLSADKENVDLNVYHVKDYAQSQPYKAQTHNKSSDFNIVKASSDTTKGYTAVTASLKSIVPAPIQADPKTLAADKVKQVSTEPLSELPLTKEICQEEKEGHYSTDSNAGSEEGHGTSEVPSSPNNEMEDELMMENVGSLQDKHKASRFGTNILLRNVSPSIQPKSAGYKKENVEKRKKRDKGNKRGMAQANISEKNQDGSARQEGGHHALINKIYSENIIDTHQWSKYTKEQVAPSGRLNEKSRTTLGDLTNIKTQTIDYVEEEFQDFNEDNSDDFDMKEKDIVFKKQEVPDFEDAMYDMDEDEPIRKSNLVVSEDLTEMKEETGTKNFLNRTSGQESRELDKSSVHEKRIEQARTAKGRSPGRVMTYGVIFGIICVILYWLHLILEKDSGYYAHQAREITLEDIGNLKD